MFLPSVTVILVVVVVVVVAGVELSDLQLNKEKRVEILFFFIIRKALLDALPLLPIE